MVDIALKGARHWHQDSHLITAKEVKKGVPDIAYGKGKDRVSGVAWQEGDLSITMALG